MPVSTHRLITAPRSCAEAPRSTRRPSGFPPHSGSARPPVEQRHPDPHKHPNRAGCIPPARPKSALHQHPPPRSSLLRRQTGSLFLQLPSTPHPTLLRGLLTSLLHISGIPCPPGMLPQPKPWSAFPGTTSLCPSPLPSRPPPVLSPEGPV